jgi:citronellol/citronellal dehydrogenase
VTPARTAAPRPSAGRVRVLAPGVLAGRTALVTGAGSGIGRAVALRLVELGADVVGAGRRADALADTAGSAAGGPGSFTARAVDVRDRPAARALVAEVGRERGLDLLVNNAGGQFVAPAERISARGFAAVTDLNLTAVAALTEAARPFLAARRGRVVALGLSSPDRGIAGLVHSATARAGVASLYGYWAEAWRAEGIALFCLAPGTVLTAGVGDELPADALAAVVEATPLGRDTSVAEVAEWVAALGSGAADALSGTLLELDGGSGLAGAASALAGVSTPRPAGTGSEGP